MPNYILTGWNYRHLFKIINKNEFERIRIANHL